MFRDPNVTVFSAFCRSGSDMRECFKSVWMCFIANSEKWAHGATVMTAVLFLASIGFAWCQLNQMKLERQWINFNEMNLRYADMLREITSNDYSKCDLNETNKIWTRRYFNLYSEEYWLYEKKLIPEEMWKDRIRPGVVVNLKEYPWLIKGYRYWRDKGAFSHPNGFYDIVKEDISNAEQDGLYSPCADQARDQTK